MRKTNIVGSKMVLEVQIWNDYYIFHIDFSLVRSTSMHDIVAAQ